MQSNEVSREFIDQAIEHFDANTPRIEKCLAQLKESEVWKRPNANSNSIGNLILHLCGNINQWINASLGGKPDTRQRDAEFDAVEGKNKAELMLMLKTVTDEARAVILGMTNEDLLAIRNVQCYDKSGIGIIIHVVEHYSYHTGQIAYWTKLLLDKDLGFYEGLELG